MACLWGAVGHLNLHMDCRLGYGIFTPDHVITADGSVMDNNHNWIVTAQKDESPDNICDPFVVYMWSLHWSVMTITSIGYGDYSPQRSVEYFVCILFMYIG